MGLNRERALATTVGTGLHAPLRPNISVGIGTGPSLQFGHPERTSALELEEERKLFRDAFRRKNLGMDPR